MDVGGWLRGLGLGKYEAAFHDNGIDDLGARPDSIQRDGAVKGYERVFCPKLSDLGRSGRVFEVQAWAGSAADRVRPWASLSML